MTSANAILAAELVLPCSDLQPSLEFFTETLGFRVDAIAPADEPTTAVMSGYGVRLRLERGADGAPGLLRLSCTDPAAVAGGARELVAPNGTRIVLIDVAAPLDLPPVRQSLVVSRGGADAQWGEGRAGMLYRDLIPDRQGGRFIASHIRITDGGPVPDYVHYHRVRFQMIYCYKGWVRVVYEDQGPPLTLRPGDCVLQPPQIRHRVLESSPGLEVIEIGCPAVHETLADHDLPLPTATLDREREFGGQRFVVHQVGEATWQPWRHEGFETRDTGIATATKGLAAVRVVRRTSQQRTQLCAHDAEFLFNFVLQGSAALRCDGHDARGLGPGDAFVVPAALPYALADCSERLELLEVSLPAEFRRVGRFPPAGPSGRDPR